MNKILIGLIALTFPLLALAQSAPRGVIEITPTIGYRWGGEISNGETDLLPYDVDVDEGESFGLMLNFPLTRGLQLELFHDRQSTRLVREHGLFETADDWADVDIDYTHIGVLYQWHTRTVLPYVAGSAGIGHIAPDIAGARSEDRFSMSLGGGIKIPISDHFAVRLDARQFFTAVDTYDGDWDDDWDDDDDHDHRDDDDFEDLSQGQVKLGFVFSF